jgi:hypothetical integral membrane protein (TIGR02206 family)
MREFFNFYYDKYPFELFSAPHLLALIFAVGCMLSLYSYKEKIKVRGKRTLKFLLIFLLILGELSFNLWYYINGKWDLTINLPFQLCSLSIYLSIFMLITKNYKIFEITFFASMTGAFIAMVTPELFFGFPHFRYFQFFIVHLVIILSCLYMLWIEEYPITFKSLVNAFLALNIISLVVYLINKMVGANYMFLTQKPHSTTMIDLLGPYPWYLLSLEGIALLLFSLLYLPFHFVKKK